ncbi:MAG: class I SAM-dependent methyltransferase [Firmicutes bacterium]|nr:class I SAM-dependent methyltransferase [Bacillota bacterium]
MKKERKVTFNEFAKEYEKFRPLYPKQLYFDIIKYTNLNKKDKILEIGCGTGKATEGFVDLYYKNITCVELGSELAKLTREKFKYENTIEVHNSSFEEWIEENNKYDLAISATAFHFINPDVGYSKVAKLLKTKGKLAFFWTIHVQSYDKLYSEIREIYRKHAPNLDDTLMNSHEKYIKDIKNRINKTGLFGDIIVKEYTWEDIYTSDEYINLLNTNSKHRLLAEKDKVLLFEGIRSAINNYGGVIKKQQLVALFLGTKLQ